jgi:dynein heavy chain, axonemal
MEFCQNIRKPVESLQSRTLVIQANLVEIKKIMSTWAKIPLFERKDARKDMVLCLDERVDRKTKRYAEIEAAAVKIKKYNTLKECLLAVTLQIFTTYFRLVNENMKLFGMDNNQNSGVWIGKR